MGIGYIAVGAVVAVASLVLNLVVHSLKFTIFIIAGIIAIFYGLNQIKNDKIEEHLSTSAAAQAALSPEARKQRVQGEVEKYLMQKTDLGDVIQRQKALNVQRPHPQSAPIAQNPQANPVMNQQNQTFNQNNNPNAKQNNIPPQQTAPQTLKFCFNCGAHVVHNSNFCGNCGTRIK